MEITAIEYVNQIDVMFKECFDAQMSRLDQYWGVWSGKVNRATKKMIEDKHPDSLMLKYGFVYWVIASELLEINHKTKGGKFFGKNKLRKKKNEMKEVRNIIDNGIDADPLGLDVKSQVGWHQYAANFARRML